MQTLIPDSPKAGKFLFRELQRLRAGKAGQHKTHNHREALCRLSPKRDMPDNTATTVEGIDSPISYGLPKCRHLAERAYQKPYLAMCLYSYKKIFKSI